MNNHKYYRVVERTVKNKKVFVTQAADSLLAVIFGEWTEYKLESEHLKDSISQIKTINSQTIKEEKTVYKISSKELNK